VALHPRALRLTVVAGLLAAGVACAAHALPVLESGRSARILDEATGRPVANVFFVVEQSHRTPAFHGSAHDCVRSAAVISRGTQAELRLPSADLGAFKRMTGESGERSFAHAPGYCTLPAWKEEGVTRVYQARRNTDPPEQRIWYLASVAYSVPRGCGKGTAPDFEQTLGAILEEIRAEARAAATTAYERHVADSVGKLFAGANPPMPASLRGRGFAIVDDAQRPRPIDWRASNTTCRNCSRIEAPVVAAPGAALAEPSPPRYRVVCRDPAACDLDRRNQTGRTYLAELLEDADIEKAMVLLAAGADPEVQRYPGGATGLDGMLGAASQSTGRALDRVRDMVKALAADGRATVKPITRQQWLALSQQGGAAETRERRGEIAALLVQLKDRPAFAPVCPLEKHWEQMLPR
jgi:hypothetical protein